MILKKNKVKKFFLIIFIFFVTNSAFALQLNGRFYQGNLIIGKTEPKSKVFIDKKEIQVSKKGFFAFGLNKDRKNDILIEVIFNGKNENLP